MYWCLLQITVMLFTLGNVYGVKILPVIFGYFWLIMTAFESRLIRNERSSRWRSLCIV